MEVAISFDASLQLY